MFVCVCVCVCVRVRVRVRVHVRVRVYGCVDGQVLITPRAREVTLR